MDGTPLSETGMSAHELDIASLLTKEWQGPKTGPRGGTYWVNTESGEKVYDDPTGDGESTESEESGDGETVDPSSMDIEELGNSLAAEMGEQQAEDLFANAESREVINDWAEVVLDPDLEYEPADIDNVDVGDSFIHPEVGEVTIAEIEANPMVLMGPISGYAISESGKAFTIGGKETERAEEELPEDMEYHDVTGLQKVQSVDIIEPDEFDVAEIEYDDYITDTVVNTARSNATAPRLSLPEREELYNGIEEVTRDGAQNLYALHRKAKQSSYSSKGQTRERAFLQAAGLDDLEYRNNTIHGSEPDEATVAAAKKFLEASQSAFDEFYEGSTEVHRGISNTAFGQLIDDYVEAQGDDITFKTFGLTNFSTEPGVAEKFGRSTAVVTREVETDEVLSYTDALFDGMQEGEISVKGGKQSIPVENIKMKNSNSDFVPIDEALKDPHPDTVASIRNSASEAAQEALL